MKGCVICRDNMGVNASAAVANRVQGEIDGMHRKTGVSRQMCAKWHNWSATHE
jgi:hypothetical protein